MKKLVLFGAGIYAEKYVSLLNYLELSFDYFTDNDSSKFSKTYMGKPIISPEELIDMDCDILISCTHGKQIMQQLSEMKISHKVINLDIICEKVKNKIEEKSIFLHNNAEMTIINDIFEGGGWGGTEMWAATISKGLSQRKHKVCILGTKRQPLLSSEMERLTERFSDTNSFEQILNSMLNKMPFTLINNFSGYAYIIAVILKKIYPDWVRVINVVHNDERSLYNANMVFAEYVDQFLCVSNKIYNTVIQEYEIDKSKVYYKEQPIEFEEYYKRVYNSHDRKVKIGYAGRLTKQQKRTEFMPQFIDYLENKNIEYVLEIAGEGECLKQIKDFVEQKKLNQKVKLLERIERDAMPCFWKNQDIVVSFSDYEGASLSMLEAMSYACVPIVTKVSGVDEFVTDGINGYVRNVGDIEGLADAIKLLSEHKFNLEIYGERCRKEIITRCRIEDYIDYISEIIEGA